MYYHPIKPEAIRYDDFVKIKFQGNRPQIIADIAEYLADFDIFAHIGVVYPNSPKRINSEEKLLKLIDLRSLYGDPKFDYYKELQASIRKYNEQVLRRLMSKFYILEDPTTRSYLPQITKKSMVLNFEKFFGAK